MQGIMTPTGVLQNGLSLLRIKGDVIGASIHATIYIYSTYAHTGRRYIYDTI